MDDRHAQFLTAVGDLCLSAALAELEVEVLTRRGDTARGVPAVEPSVGAREADSSGYARTFRVDAHLIDLDDVVACTLHCA